jgi:putative acetyltransferase
MSIARTLTIRISVRHESLADWECVAGVVRDAFGQDAEARLVASLRSIPGVLSLVGIVDNIIVGHVMFSPVTARGKSPAAAAYGLAPVSVSTNWQKRGIGSRLIAAGLEELRRSRVGLVVVLGHTSYYPRFGFVAAAPLGLTCKWGGDDGAFQVLELVDGAVRAYQGIVDYAPTFDEFV